jgi:3-oxoacyl-[acyl-carrier protein] reductase
MSDSNGKTALVTGASRGIGRAIVHHLARDGYDIAFCYRQAVAAAASVEQELLAMGRRVYHQPCDVADLRAVQSFVAAAERTLGPLAVAVNSAGIIRDHPLVVMEQGAWSEVIRVNLDGVFNVCRTAVFGFMKRKRGSLVNISSVAGVYGNPAQTNYCASKAGIIGFSKALAKEVGSYGVRVNVVAPGLIGTDMTEGLAAPVVSRTLSHIPLGRIGEAADVAEVVSFLASDRARYITGQTLHVDGGITL